MKVKLVACTPGVLAVVYTAVRTCYSSKTPSEIFEGVMSEQWEEGNRTGYESYPSPVEEKMASLIRKVIKQGHTSILEHVSFTFAIEGISRVCSHQLVRHRIASYSQQSQRHVAIEWDGNIDKAVEDDLVILPESIAKSEEAKVWYLNHIFHSLQRYEFLVKRFGIPLEDARYILPNAMATNIVVTMNARELHHFFRLRCCFKAQWEIRELAGKMLEAVREVAPVIFEEAGADCDNCKEDWPECPIKILMDY